MKRTSKRGIGKALNLEIDNKEGYVDDVAITKELVKRIPFLKNYVVSVKKISQLKADYIGEKISNLQVMSSKGKIITISEYRPISRFFFTMTKIDDNRKTYSFSIMNSIKVTPTDVISKDTLNDLLLAVKLFSKEHSFNVDMTLDNSNGDTMLLTSELFEDIISRANKAFYTFHEISEKQEIPNF